MPKIDELMSLYRQLCDYCDNIVGAIAARHSDDIACKPGCSSCCTIRSVTKLEALAIEEYVQAHELVIPVREQGEFCLFLQNSLCSIYPVRPVICRTHGLILYDSQDDSVSGTCAFNFTKKTHMSIERRDTIDAVNITENLIRLNLALLRMTAADSSDTGRSTMERLIKNLNRQSDPKG